MEKRIDLDFCPEPLLVYHAPMKSSSTIPLVLAIGGHDPSGGAGLQADIESIAGNGCRALSVVTALTTQTTCKVERILPQPPDGLLEQCRLLLDESRVGAIKIGMLGSQAMARAVAELLAEHPGIPVVLDPVLASGGGTDLANEDLQQAIIDTLCPHCTLLTPNSPEARRLGGRDTLEGCASRLIDACAAAVLVTGAHEADRQVINRLYGLTGLLREDAWPRLEGEFHGSGCTLAAAVAAGLARGLKLSEAVFQAQDYTWNTLRQALSTGRCQLTPNRLYRLPSVSE